MYRKICLSDLNISKESILIFEEKSDYVDFIEIFFDKQQIEILNSQNTKIKCVDNYQIAIL